MGTDYKIRVYNTSGVLKHEITDFQSLSYSKGVNLAGLANWQVNGAHPVVGDIADKWQVEIWRRIPAFAGTAGVDWYRDFAGHYREPDWEGVDPGMFKALCPGDLAMLGWRIVAWPAGKNLRSQFESDKAETVMKTLADYNAGPNATTGNGRQRTGSITGITIESDGANGNTVDWYCAYDNLLKTLQELALIAGGDFDLVKTGSSSWEFRWYTGQLGTDRTVTVIFANELGNMANPKFRQRRMKERTVAIVAGQGEGDDRDIEVRTGTDYSASNDLEMFVDARDVTIGNSDALQDRGDQKLVEVEAEEEFEFDVLQIPSTLYGEHYFLGDLVTARSPFSGSELTRKVMAVDVTVERDGRERIRVGLGNS